MITCTVYIITVYSIIIDIIIISADNRYGTNILYISKIGFKDLMSNVKFIYK